MVRDHGHMDGGSYIRLREDCDYTSSRWQPNALEMRVGGPGVLPEYNLLHLC